MSLKEKLLEAVQDECKYADKEGSSRLSVCDHYNWDKDLWDYRSDIIEAIKTRGYNVSVSVRHGVTDIVTRQIINL